MPVKFRTAAPMFVRVNDTGELDCPTMREPNFQLCGTSFTVPVVRLIVAVADFVVSLTAVAVIATVGLAGRLAGGVYVLGLPLAVLVGNIEPQVEQADEACIRAQSAPAFAGSFAMVAVSGKDEVNGIRALPGNRETVIAGTVMEAVAVAPLYATDVAVTTTLRSAVGAVPGAV